MPGLLPDVDPDGLLEYSVVYTDRALNHMSRKFQGVMRDISGVLKEVYHARSAIVVPGSGTFGMEAVARQFATGQQVLVIRNGWFSYRWTQIFEMGRIPSRARVLKARRVGAGRQGRSRRRRSTRWWPPSAREKPAVVFAPHVETAAGMMLPDDYLRAVADAVHEVGGLFVLDCIASGAMWVDMEATGVDVLVSAPQKGWSGSPCCAFVMLSERARTAIDGTTSTSFALDLKKWLQIMETYERRRPRLPRHDADRCADAHARRDAGDPGLRLREAARRAARARPQGARAAGAPAASRSVAAEGFQAPGVVVSYTDDDGLHSGKSFLAEGLQTGRRRAAAVRRAGRLQDLPHRPVRAGEAAARRPHGGHLEAALDRIASAGQRAAA